MFIGSRRALANYSPPLFLPPVKSTFQTLSHSGSVLTGTALPIGDPFPFRRVIVLAMSGGHSGRTQVSQTIGGVAATFHGEVSGPSNEWVCFISAIVPSGNTADVTLTANSTLFAGGDAYCYAIDDRALRESTPTVATSTTTAGTSISPSLSTRSGGIIVAGVRWSNGSGKSPVTPTGFTSDYNTSAAQAFSYSQYPSQLTLALTTSWTGSFDCASAALSWR